MPAHTTKTPPTRRGKKPVPRDARFWKLTKAFNRLSFFGLLFVGWNLLAVLGAHSWGIFGNGYFLVIALTGFTAATLMAIAAIVLVKRWTSYNQPWGQLLVVAVYGYLVWLTFHYGWVYLHAMWSLHNYG